MQIKKISQEEFNVLSFKHLQWVLDGKKGLDESGPVDFRNLDLSGLIFKNLNLENADFTGSRFTNSNIERCNLINAKFINVELEHVYFYDCDLSGSKFLNIKNMKSKIGAETFGSISGFTRCKLLMSSFINTCLVETDFMECQMWEMKFISTTIEKVKFYNNKSMEKAVFKDSKFYKTVFDRNNLAETIIEDCNFNKSVFKLINFRKSKIDETNFIDCEWYYVIGNGSKIQTLQCDDSEVAIIDGNIYRDARDRPINNWLVNNDNKYLSEEDINWKAKWRPIFKLMGANI